MNFSIKTVKDTLHNDDRDILFIKLEYPVFESEGNETVCKKLSDYYEKGKNEFEKYCKTQLFENVKRENNKCKCGANMNARVPFADTRYLSVICDVSFFDGKRKRSTRLSDNWCIEGDVPRRIKKSELFPVTRRAKKLYTDEICSKINDGEGGFSFFDNAVIIAKRRFDEERFYLTPKGIAFYYEKNVLFPEKEGFPSFVIPYDAVKNLF